MRTADHSRRVSAIVALVACMVAGRALAQASSVVAAEARTLLERNNPSQAIALLKPAIEAQPLDKNLRLWLARAYLDDANDFWALRTLIAASAIHPEDCNLVLWQAHIQLRQGAVDQARDLLQAPCATWAPVEARRSLLFAMVEQAAGSTEDAQAHLDQARAFRFAFPEDREAMARMRAGLMPGYLAPLSGRLDLALGGTTNARAGSPVDPESQGNGAGSLAVQAAGSMRFVSPNRTWPRLSVEAEARGIGYQAAAGRDLSYLLLGGRPGVLLDLLGRRALVAYRYERLLLAGGDGYDSGPVWFFDAHRGELELELGPHLTFFGGAGRRTFREMARTRTEVDGGVGSGFSVGPRFNVMGALSGRYHDARNNGWDLRGGSLLVSAEWRTPSLWSARAGALASTDDYPHSAGYFGTDQARGDRLLRLSASLFAPPWDNHVKVGVTYEFAVRDSTADVYDYVDHRILAKLAWTFTADPWLPHPATPLGHVPIDWRMKTVELAERIQDLLRQEEATQRSSSCRD
jgi:tetratricopeptide (TPR) repeat protein